MNQAIKTLVLFSALLITLVHSTTLKSPKVYNALITTDQNLIPSRAYPVVQPTIHDAGFGYSAFGLGHHHHQNAFGLYDPYAGPYHHHGGFVGGPVPGYQARNQFSFFSHQAKNAAGVSAAAAEESAASGVTNDQAIISGNDAQLDAGSVSSVSSVASANSLKENLPIPLNEYGLPPNLIPLSTAQDFNRQGNPVNLQPYPYNSYPLIYDSFGGYNVNPYLPPFNYYPSVFGAGAAGAAAGAAPGALPGAGPVGPLDGAAGDAGAVGGDDGVADGGAGGDIDDSQGGDVDGGAGGDDGGAGGSSGGSGGDSDGGAASEKINDGGSGGSSSSSTSGGSGGSSGSSSSSGGSGGSGTSTGGGSSGSSSSSGYRGGTRRTGFRGSNIRSALRADAETPTQ